MILKAHSLSLLWTLHKIWERPGFGISGAVAFTPLDQAKAQFDVNFFGTVNVNKAVLPSMREAGKGHIINISAVAAVAHIPFQAFYSASNAAISSYSNNEVKPYCSFFDVY